MNKKNIIGRFFDRFREIEEIEVQQDELIKNKGDEDLLSMESVDEPDENLFSGYNHEFMAKEYNYSELSHQQDFIGERDEKFFISRKSQRRYNLFSILFTIMIAVVLLIMVDDSPQSYIRENPTNNEVSARYVEKGLEETGATNIVAGLILDYRAFDTFGEATMIFTAGIGSIMLLENFTPKRKEEFYEDV